MMEMENYEIINEYYSKKEDSEYEHVDTERPDGDVELNSNFIYKNFKDPRCLQCEEILKPNLVFFGENVPDYVKIFLPIFFFF